VHKSVGLQAMQPELGERQLRDHCDRGGGQPPVR